MSIQIQEIQELQNKYTNGENFVTPQMMKACENGDLEVAKYLYSINPGYAIFPGTLSMACKNGDLKLAKFLVSIGKEILYMHIREAAVSGNLELVKFIYSNKENSGIWFKGENISSETLHRQNAHSIKNNDIIEALCRCKVIHENHEYLCAPNKCKHFYTSELCKSNCEDKCGHVCKNICLRKCEHPEIIEYLTSIIDC
jgi:hypothetical protein